MFIQKILFSSHLDENEQIYYVGHKHWIDIISKLFVWSLLGVAIPWFFFIITGVSILMFFAIIVTIITYLRLFYVLIDWYCDAVIVTSESLIFVDWDGLFKRKSTRVSYSSIESIDIEINGFFSMVFSYGRLAIERDAAPSIGMYPVRKPKRLELEITRGKDLHEEVATSQSQDALREILSAMVADHVKKHGWKK